MKNRLQTLGFLQCFKIKSIVKKLPYKFKYLDITIQARVGFLS